MDSWHSLMSRRFRPSEVEAITGHSTTMQRKWIERYFDFADGSYHLGMLDSGMRSHRRFSWVGVQLIAVFGDVLSDLSNAENAQMALRSGGNEESVDDLWNHDLRERSEGDIFAIHFPDRPHDQRFTTTNLKYLPSIIGDHWGNRAYLYNISGMQRRLVNAASKIGHAIPAVVD